MSQLAKKGIKSILRAFGVGVVRLKTHPTETLLGLRAQPFRTIIDVGANEGQFAKYARGFFPDAEFYCFEPLPIAYRHLRSWAENHRQIRTFNIGLGEGHSQAIMYHHIGHSPSSSLLETTEFELSTFPETTQQQPQVVEVERLDTVMGPHLATARDDILLKLDVQGFEDRVLRGAEHVLSRSRACIVEVNFAPLYKGQARFLDIALLLDKAGLSYVGNLAQVYSSEGEALYIDAVFRRG